MADVKFMDLSENDNPATTDSILIGNSTDGLKRTSVGAIGNLFAVKSLFHFELVTLHTDPAANPPHMTPINAPDVPGYTFAFWLAPSPIGNYYYSHINTPMDQHSHLWVIINDGGSSVPLQFNCIAVYGNSKVA